MALTPPPARLRSHLPLPVLASSSFLQASIVPALCGLLLTPLLMYKLFPPEIKDTPEAPKVRGAAGTAAVPLLAPPCCWAGCTARRRS